MGYYKLVINEQTVFDSLDSSLGGAGQAYGDNLWWLDGYTTTYTLKVTICPNTVSGSDSVGTNLHANI